MLMLMISMLMLMQHRHLLHCHPLQSFKVETIIIDIVDTEEVATADNMMAEVAAGRLFHYKHSKKPKYYNVVTTTASNSAASSPASSLHSRSSTGIIGNISMQAAAKMAMPESSTTASELLDIVEENTDTDTNPRGAIAAQLLQNMMRTHKNRNPYKDYCVLGMIGKGSIGSVEKVVRKHHAVMNHGEENDEEEENAKHREGDSFCCNANSLESCWGSFFLCKLFSFNNKKHTKNKNDVFQSNITTTHSSTRTIDGSIVSESSAFSAPPTPTMGREQRLHIATQPANGKHTVDRIQSSSQHGNAIVLSSSLNLEQKNGHGATKNIGSSYHYYNLNHHNSRHGQQHPLQKYALKSIRLEIVPHPNFLGPGIALWGYHLVMRRNYGMKFRY